MVFFTDHYLKLKTRGEAEKKQRRERKREQKRFRRQQKQLQKAKDREEEGREEGGQNHHHNEVDIDMDIDTNDHDHDYNDGNDREGDAAVVGPLLVDLRLSLREEGEGKSDYERFFLLCARLPMELQMRVCLLAEASPRTKASACDVPISPQARQRAFTSVGQRLAVDDFLRAY